MKLIALFLLASLPLAQSQGVQSSVCKPRFFEASPAIGFAAFTADASLPCSWGDCTQQRWRAATEQFVAGRIDIPRGPLGPNPWGDGSQQVRLVTLEQFVAGLTDIPRGPLGPNPWGDGSQQVRLVTPEQFVAGLTDIPRGPLGPSPWGDGTYGLAMTTELLGQHVADSLGGLAGS